jgi:hypothetical protein
MWHKVEKKVIVNKQPIIQTFNDIKLFPVYSGPISKPDKNIPNPHKQCFCCREYYNQLNLAPTELNKRVQNVSKHKDIQRPITPEHFWDIDFPI